MENSPLQPQIIQPPITQAPSEPQLEIQQTPIKTTCKRGDLELFIAFASTSWQEF